MYYGVDIGGTKIELAVFSPQLRLLDKWRIATQGDDYQSFLASLALQISEADRRWPAESGIPGTVGIALPGVIRADGTVVSSNVPCLNQRKVAEDLGALLSRPVALGNDCRCFALSEALLGAGKDHARVLGLILGTGLGGGICIEGRLITGAHCLAGEFGHQGMAASVLLRHGLPLYDCGCGLKGCAETYVSGTGLGRIYRAFGGEGDTYAWLAALRAGDAIAKRSFDAYLDALGSVLAGQILSLDPDIFVFGGGLSEVPEILAALPQATARHMFNGVQLPEFCAAQFGAASGVRGAAMLGKALATRVEQSNSVNANEQVADMDTLLTGGWHEQQH